MQNGRAGIAISRGRIGATASRRCSNRSKVETVGVNQSILGRVLGYGTVIVRGTGGSFEPIQFIGDPLTFRSHITAG